MAGHPVLTPTAAAAPTAPDGATENGTAVFIGNKLMMTLTEAGAWKLGNDLADALEKNRRNAA